MATTITEVKNHLTGMLHGGTLNKVRNFEHALERAAESVLANIKPIESERNQALTSLVYDDIYNYSLAVDFGWPIDILPQDNRGFIDQASRKFAESFDLKKALASKQVSIEGRDGVKFIRINWRTRAPITIHSMNSLTGNGTWATVATATGLKVQTLFKISGNASIEFDVAATGDGIQNTGLSNLDLTDEDEQIDAFGFVHIPTAADLANFNSATVRWGNDVSSNYWESAAEDDQADGTAFGVGWNLLKWLWSDATESSAGAVDPALIDSFRFVVDVDAAIANLKVDNLVFAVGRNFDMKYYSKFAFRTSTGTYLVRPTSDDDTVVFDSTGFLIFLQEALKACAAQIEGADSSFDILNANLALHGDPKSPDPIQRVGLYAKYRAEYPAQTKRPTRNWANPRSANFSRR